MTEKIVAIQIKGAVDAPHKIRDALQHLKLGQTNQATILEDNQSTQGMLQKAKDYITYGTLDEETEEILKNKTDTLETGTTINLTPPSGGFKSTKKHVKQGGSLGKRGNINTLLQKMA